MSSERSDKAVNVPNILTLTRILLTPLFIILLLQNQLSLALIVFAVAGISNGLDGLIARWFNQRTILGAYLDPVADKVMLVSAFVCLAILGIIPDWLAVIVLSRDILIVIGIAIFTLTEKKFQIRPSLVSKWTTAAQTDRHGVCLFDGTRHCRTSDSATSDALGDCRPDYDFRASLRLHRHEHPSAGRGKQLTKSVSFPLTPL